MKNILLSALFFFAFTAGVFAQDDDDMDDSSENTEVLKNKKGQTILPQAGDFAVGIDAKPIIGALGGISYDPDFLTTPTTFFFKYFNSDESALRVKFQFETARLNFDRYVQDDAAVLIDPLSEARVFDRMTTLNRSFGLGLGYEMHRGRGRLKAVYGAELGFWYFHGFSNYQYGNAFTTANTAPTTWDFNTNLPANMNRRPISSVDANGYGVGLEAFLGIEYFFMPDISIGTEVSWGPHATFGGQESHIDQYWNGVSVQEQTLLDAPGDFDLITGLNNPSVFLYLMFHF